MSHHNPEEAANAELFQEGYISPRNAVKQLMEAVESGKDTLVIYPKDGGTETYNLKKEARAAEGGRGMLNVFRRLREPQSKKATVS